MGLLLILECVLHIIISMEPNKEIGWKCFWPEAIFGWSNFSVTVVELYPRKDVFPRENWYLSRFQPLLNVLKSTNIQVVLRKARSLSTNPI